MLPSDDMFADTGITGSVRAFEFHLLCIRTTFNCAPLEPYATASHVRCAAPNVVEYIDMLRILTGSILYPWSESRVCLGVHVIEKIDERERF